METETQEKSRGELTRKQKKIVEATLDLLQTEGLEKVTMKRIARRIEVTDGALYNHFKSKKEIFEAIHRQVIGTYEELMEEIHHRQNEDAGNVLPIIMKKYEDLFFSDPRLVYLVRNYGILFKNYPDLVEEMRGHSQRAHQSFTGKIEEGVTAGYFPQGLDGENLFHIINGAFMSLYTHLFLEDRVDEVKERGEKLWKQLSILLGL